MSQETATGVWPATDDDLWQTARSHVAELPHGLFPRLGRGFVRRWHRAHLRSPHGVVLVACDGMTVVGFVVGATDQRANVAWIVDHLRSELILSAGRAMILRPRVLATFLRTRWRRYARRLLGRDGASPDVSTTPTGDAVAVLEAIVVDPRARQSGVGTALVRAFLEAVAEAGTDRVELVTKADARGARGFYERQGWRFVGTHVDRDGDEVITYRLDALAVGTG